MVIAGKKAVISGGASGLGLATAEYMVAKGAKTALWDLNQKEGVKSVTKLGEAAIFNHVDVFDEASVAAGVLEVVHKLGGIDIVVNCAGVGTPAKLIGKNGPVDMAIWSQVVQINLMGTVNVMRLAGAQMAGNQPGPDGERGVFINTASVAAFDGQVGHTAYAASKAGLVGLTLPAAREFAQLGIRVVTIAPGLFKTPMFLDLPEKVRVGLVEEVPFPARLGDPAEFAAMAGHIIENSMLNGETIRLDGALRMVAK